MTEQRGDMMPVVRPLIEARHGWQCKAVRGGKLWAKGVLYGEDWASFAQRVAAGPEAAASAVLHADGHFAVVYQTEDWCFAATDRVGSIPVLHLRGAGTGPTHFSKE